MKRFMFTLKSPNIGTLEVGRRQRLSGLRESLSQKCRRFLLLPAILGIFLPLQVASARDYLTDKEIELIQDTQSVASRARIYMEAAALRIKTAQDKLSNKEYAEGDPMEFLTPEDVLNDYGKILRSLQFTLESAIESPRHKGYETIGKALKYLKEETPKELRELKVLLQIAVEKHRDTFAERIKDAIDATQDFLEDVNEKSSELRTNNPPMNK
jgi:hypothetical protein